MTTEPQIAQPALEVNTSTKKYKGVGTLRRRLLTFVLPAIILPIVIVTVAEETIIRQKNIADADSELYNSSYLATNSFIEFLQNSQDTNRIITSSPSIIKELRLANQKTLQENLPLIPIQELEQKFSQNKLLISDLDTNKYLKQIVKNDKLAEVIITERNGFNVGYSSPTSDFVQRDEFWWRKALVQKYAVEPTELDKSANTEVIPISQEIKDPDTGVFLGIVKTGFSTEFIKKNIESNFTDSLIKSQNVQVLDTLADVAMITINSSGSNSNSGQLEVDEKVRSIAKTIVGSVNTNRNVQDIRGILNQEYGISNIDLEQKKILAQTSLFARLSYQGKIYSLSTIPDTNLITIASINESDIYQLQKESLQRTVLITIIFVIASTILVALLAQRISRPLNNLSKTTQLVAEGDLDTQVNLEGTLETYILADNFNNLIEQVKKSLQTQQNIAEEQRQEKDKLETAIYTLLDEVSDATDGDLTVRANLDSMELSTVADLFNAIITNLQDIAIEAKQSSNQVGFSLKENESAIRTLAEQAIAEAQETRDTLLSVEQMSLSIKAVADNANQAEKIADDTYSTVVNSTNNMDLTVNSILDLRTTVGETAKKMKRLGESSQKISQAVSFIEEIALKTNVLAINASVEAGKAGEYGEGFTIVAEQVGALAEQSAAATKEIAKIVAAIQTETQEVNQALESGTIQVVETTRLVENTKESLGLVLEKSQAINQLMESIAQSTVSQTMTSENVTNLMQKIAELSEASSQSSARVAQSIVDTAEVAAKLESTVAQFKVAESVSS